MAHAARQQLEQREAAEAAAAEAGEAGLAQRPEVAVLVKADVQVRTIWSLPLGLAAVWAPSARCVNTVRRLPKCCMTGAFVVIQ